MSVKYSSFAKIVEIELEVFQIHACYLVYILNILVKQQLFRFSPLSYLN